jgi:hypothetical protein
VDALHHGKMLGEPGILLATSGRAVVECRDIPVEDESSLWFALVFRGVPPMLRATFRRFCQRKRKKPMSRSKRIPPTPPTTPPTIFGVLLLLLPLADEVAVDVVDADDNDDGDDDDGEGDGLEIVIGPVDEGEVEDGALELDEDEDNEDDEDDEDEDDDDDDEVEVKDEDDNDDDDDDDDDSNEDWIAIVTFGADSVPDEEVDVGCGIEK